MKDFVCVWSISIGLYLINILCSIFLYSQMDLPGLFLVMNLLGITVTFFIFKSVCVVDNIPYNKFWGLYVLLLFLYGTATDLLGVEKFIMALPFYLYHFFLMTVIIYVIVRKWDFSNRIKIGGALILLAGRGIEIYCSLSIILGSFTLISLYLSICSLLLLNFMMNLLYQIGLKTKQKVQNDYLFALAENAGDIIFYYTLYPYPRFTFISPSVSHILGYKQQEFYDNPKFHLELTHEEDRDIIKKAFSEEAGSAAKNAIRWQRKDGEYVYLEFNNTPILSDEKVVAIEGIFRDITERKLIEQEMIDSKKSKQLLLSYISHELKTPITYIVGYAEGIQKNLFQNDEERMEAIDLIAKKAVFLQKLVEDLFQLSKMESNQFSFEFMQTKVYDLFLRLDEKHSNDVLNTGIRYTAAIDERLKDEKYEVLVDIKRIEQVFANILQNAIKHTPENGIIECTCSLDERRENVVFRIKDSGEGIPKEELPFVFKKFYRGKGPGIKSAEGSGLGLSLSLQIIEAHKGNLTAQSNKDKGSTFSFTIPLYTEET